MDEAETIRELYRRYWRCMIDKDAEGLRAIMAEDYTLTHMTGVRQSAENFLKGLLDGTFNYYAAEHDGIEVTVSGDRAAMIGKSRVLAAVYGGGKHSWHCRVCPALHSRFPHTAGNNGTGAPCAKTGRPAEHRSAGFSYQSITLVIVFLCSAQLYGSNRGRIKKSDAASICPSGFGPFFQP